MWIRMHAFLKSSYSILSLQYWFTPRQSIERIIWAEIEPECEGTRVAQNVIGSHYADTTHLCTVGRKCSRSQVQRRYYSTHHGVRYSIFYGRRCNVDLVSLWKVHITDFERPHSVDTHRRFFAVQPNSAIHNRRGWIKLFSHYPFNQYIHFLGSFVRSLRFSPP